MTLQIALSIEKSGTLASTRLAVRYVMDSSAYVCASIVAILSLMSPKSPMLRPNARRSWTRSSASRISVLHAPTHPAEARGARC